MITSNGMYVLSDYKRLEKIHGPDKTIGILNRIHNELEKENYIKNINHNDESVRLKSKELYENIIKEMKDDI